MRSRRSWNLWIPALVCASAVHASNNGDIEELIITASPHGKTIDEIAGTINSLGGEELQRAAANTLGETLKDQLGINMSSFGPGVGVPVIRGLSGDRIEILQNSVPLTDASSTSPDHAIALEPLLADRIEILRGPATLRFGPGAIGGVINIIDNRIHLDGFSGAEAAIETRYNTNCNGRTLVSRTDLGNGLYSAHFSGVTRDSNNIDIPGNAAANVSNVDETTDGYIANSDMNALAFNLGISRVTDDLIVGAAASHVRNKYGIPPAAHVYTDEGDMAASAENDQLDMDEFHGPDEFVRIDMEQTEYSSKVRLPALPGFFSALFLDLSHSNYQHTELEITASGKSPGTRYKTESNYVSMELVFGDDSPWRGTVGLQYQDTDFSSVGDETFVPPNISRRGGSFITAEHDFYSGTLEIGLRYDYQINDKDHGPHIGQSLLNASTSYIFPIDDANQLSIILTHAERAPSPEELFALGEHLAINRYQVGDPTLSRETSNNFEFTWRHTSQLDVTASIFHRRFSDFIYERNEGTFFSENLAAMGLIGTSACSSNLADFDNNPTEFETALGCAITSQDDAHFTGVEAGLTAPLTDNLNLRVWGDKVRARLDDNGDVPRIPPARLGAELNLLTGRWSAGMSITHAFDQNRPGNFESDTADYTRFDTYLSFNTDDMWTIFLNAKNLTNEEIRNAVSYLKSVAPEPGRSIEVGARLHF